MIQDSFNKFTRYVIDPVVGGAIVAGVSSLAQTGLNALQNKGSYSRWRRTFDHAHKANIEDWNMQNEYNLPINQLKRLRDAGINPNFALQSGGVTAQGGTISSSSGSDLSQTPLGDSLGKGIGQGLEAMMALSQKDNIKADTEYKQAMTKGQEIQNNLDEKFGVQQRESAVALNRAMSNLSDKQAMSIVKTIDEQIHVLRSTAHRNEAEERELNALLEFKKQVMSAQTNSFNASANLSNTLAEEEPKRTEISSRGVSAQEEANRIAKYKADNEFALGKYEIQLGYAQLAEKTNYDTGTLSLQRTSVESLANLQEALAGTEDLKQVGMKFDNALSSLEWQFRDEIRKLHLDTKKEKAFISELEQRVKESKTKCDDILFNQKLSVADRKNAVLNTFKNDALKVKDIWSEITGYGSFKSKLSK